MTQHPPVGQGHNIIVASLSHSDTLHSLRLFWTRNRPVAEITNWRHNIKKRETSLFQEGFEPVVPRRKRLQTQAIDGASAGIG